VWGQGADGGRAEEGRDETKERAEATMTRYILMRIYKPVEVDDQLDRGKGNLPAGYMPVFDDIEQVHAWNPDGHYEITMMEG
jgi:hypothetical protein